MVDVHLGVVHSGIQHWPSATIFCLFEIHIFRLQITRITILCPYIFDASNVFMLQGCSILAGFVSVLHSSILPGGVLCFSRAVQVSVTVITHIPVVLCGRYIRCVNNLRGIMYYITETEMKPTR